MNFQFGVYDHYNINKLGGGKYITIYDKFKYPISQLLYTIDEEKDVNRLDKFLTSYMRIDGKYLGLDGNYTISEILSNDKKIYTVELKENKVQESVSTIVSAGIDIEYEITEYTDGKLDIVASITGKNTVESTSDYTKIYKTINEMFKEIFTNINISDLSYDTLEERGTSREGSINVDMEAFEKECNAVVSFQIGESFALTDGHFGKFIVEIKNK